MEERGRKPDADAPAITRFGCHGRAPARGKRVQHAREKRGVALLQRRIVATLVRQEEIRPTQTVKELFFGQPLQRAG